MIFYQLNFKFSQVSAKKCFRPMISTFLSMMQYWMQYSPVQRKCLLVNYTLMCKPYFKFSQSIKSQPWNLNLGYILSFMHSEIILNFLIIIHHSSTGISRNLLLINSKIQNEIPFLSFLLFLIFSDQISQINSKT